MTLNQNQERVVAVTLRLLEDRLAEIERLMTAREEGVLYRRTSHLDPQQRTQMDAVIGELRAEIQKLAGTFHLPREDQDAARKVVGLLSVTWESLEELRPRHLKSYGDVDPGLKETLEPAVSRLTHLVLLLEALAQQSAQVSNGKER